MRAQDKIKIDGNAMGKGTIQSGWSIIPVIFINQSPGKEEQTGASQGKKVC